MTFNRRALLLTGAAIGVLGAPAVLRAQTRTLADTLAADPRFLELLDLMTRGGAIDDLRQAAPLTLFAPVNEAFNNAPAGQLSALRGQNQGGGSTTPDREAISVLVRNHMVPGNYTAAMLTGGERMLTTLNGTTLKVEGGRSPILVSNAKPVLQQGQPSAGGIHTAGQPAQVVQADIMASNGVIHAVSQIIWP
jgi:uncharacterized surface protein with fasciclin (FAS1) repeats